METLLEQPKGKKVLVADDDSDSRAVVVAALATLNVSILEAEDGNAAAKICQAVVPDLAVLDYNMPGMKGTEVCRRIRALPNGELIPIIMLTALDTLQDKVRAFEHGVDDYLTKPFHCQELLARVRALLRVRALNLRLAAQNCRLQEMQEMLLQQERQIIVSQLAGTAAHQLGQPLSAIILNCYLVQTLKPEDPKYQRALAAITHDARRMSEMLEKLKGANAARTSAYHADMRILDIEDVKER
jgi:DNA-binding response OmpR family regulator